MTTEPDMTEQNLALIREYLLSATHNGIVTDALGECIDFGNHPQIYGSFPWGQGAALAFLSAYEASVVSGDTRKSKPASAGEVPA